MTKQEFLMTVLPRFPQTPLRVAAEPLGMEIFFEVLSAPQVWLFILAWSALQAEVPKNLFFEYPKISSSGPKSLEIQCNILFFPQPIVPLETPEN